MMGLLQLNFQTVTHFQEHELSCYDILVDSFAKLVLIVRELYVHT